MPGRLGRIGPSTCVGITADPGLVPEFASLRRRRDDIRYIHMRHEEVAAMAAVGYAKFTGRLGVCFATAAPEANAPRSLQLSGWGCGPAARKPDHRTGRSRVLDGQ